MPEDEASFILADSLSGKPSFSMRVPSSWLTFVGREAQDLKNGFLALAGNAHEQLTRIISCALI